MIAVYSEGKFSVSMAGNDDWEIAWPWLERAMPYSQGRLSAEQMRNRVRDGTSQLWIACDGDNELGACMTSVVGDGCMVEAVGADNLDDYLVRAMTTIERVMQERYGCRWVQVVGRMGWGKKLRALGYNPQVLMCEKRFI